MFYLLAFFAISGMMVPAEDWGRDKRFPTLEACTVKRIEFQAVLDKAQAQDRRNGIFIEPIKFECRLGPEIMAGGMQTWQG